MPRKSNRVGHLTVGRLIDTVLDPTAPLRLAQSWDNVGLLVGDRSAACTGLLLCIDLTEDILAEAVRKHTNLILAYHPVLIRPILSISATSSSTDRLLWMAARNGLSVYSPHTALDAAIGGSNDVLAEICGLAKTEPFEYVAAAPPEKKLVTFVPEANVDLVAEALFRAGAGRIGEYEKCSYRSAGEGTFFGGDSTHPAVGRRGQLERVPEVRLECVVPGLKIPGVLDALRSAHPYEEPAFDVYTLDPDLTAGAGRIGNLEKPETLAAFARRVAKAVGVRCPRIVGSRGQRVSRVAVCVGAAGRMTLEGSFAQAPDVTVTGEIRHHDALSYRRAGRCAIALGHWASERPMLESLQKRIRVALKGTPVRISREDRDPFEVLVR